MAGRQNKVGLDYFELDCHMDEKIELIEAEYGLKGFAIVVKLYQSIFSGFGYYCEWYPDISVLWARRLGLSHGGDYGNVGSASAEGSLPGFPKNLINDVVAASIKRNIFSKDLFQRYGILTSSGIQKRYLSATSKREKVELKKEYLLISIPKNRVNVVINSISGGRNSISDGRNSQSKVEKSRVEERKEEKNNPPLSHFEGETEEKVDKNKRKRFVPPTVEEVEDYCLERNNSIDAQAFVDFYSSKDWMIGKNRMKDWKAAVRTWERNRLQSGGSGRQKQNNDVNVSRQSQLDYLLGKIREEEGL